RGRVLQLADLVDPLQSEAEDRIPMATRGPACAADQLDLQGLLRFVAHRLRSGTAQPRISSTDLPRLAAVSDGVDSWVNAFSVARTRLYGLLEPWLLATTLVTPITSNTARIGPPAITPVPSSAGEMNTRDAPWRPCTTWWIVPFFSGTLNSLRRASSIAFCTDTGTSRALPLPMPTRPSPSPTTASAAKPRIRPPLTTLVTRLMPIIFSFRPSSRSSVARCGPLA